MQDEKKNQGIPVEESKPRKKPGRHPMTPEEKAAAAKARAEEKAKADNLKPEVIVQYQESEAVHRRFGRGGEGRLSPSKKAYPHYSHEAVCQTRGTHGLLCYQ